MSLSPASPAEAAANPQLSVILAIGGQRERAAAALRSVLAQEMGDALEVLVIDLGPKDSLPLPGSDDRRVRLIVPEQNWLLDTARLHGLRAARAPLVAFMEEHCEAQPGWAEATIRALSDRWAAASGEFILGNPGSGTSAKAFRMTYGSYVRSTPRRGPTDYVSGQNAAFKRDVLLGYDDRLALMLKSDAALPMYLRRDGHEFFCEPAARMTHRSETTVGSLGRGAFYWNWCFANARAQLLEWSPFRKGLQLCLIPLIPWVRLIKLTARISRRGKTEFLQLLRDIPFVLAIDHCAAAGQAIGLVRASAVAEQKFSDFEMNEPRLLLNEWEAARKATH